MADRRSGTGANKGWWPLLWFVAKVLLFIFFFIWLRGTLPRLRYDQFMRLGWKVLIPVALAWLLMVATVRALNTEYHVRQPRRCFSTVASSLVVLIALTFVWDLVAARASRREAPEVEAEFDPMAGGHPVPPMPGQQLPALTAVGAGETSATARGEGRPMTDLLTQLKGFGVTFGTMFKKVVTEQYPERRRPTEPRFHGRHQLNRHPDGLEKCIGCELCAWACPADAIYVEGADNTDGERFSPGERYGRVYQINYRQGNGDHQRVIERKAMRAALSSAAVASTSAAAVWHSDISMWRDWRRAKAKLCRWMGRALDAKFHGYRNVNAG